MAWETEITIQESGQTAKRKYLYLNLYPVSSASAEGDASDYDPTCDIPILLANSMRYAACLNLNK